MEGRDLPGKISKSLSLDPEDREVQRRRGRQITDPAIERQMRDL
jgi:hypothetical protein